MFPTTNTTQIITPFGSGYVPEQHGDKALWTFASNLLDEVQAPLRASTLIEMLKSLRSALYLR